MSEEGRAKQVHRILEGRKGAAVKEYDHVGEVKEQQEPRV